MLNVSSPVSLRTKIFSVERRKYRPDTELKQQKINKNPNLVVLRLASEEV